MTKQLKLEDFELPEVATDEIADYSPKAKVICGMCGSIMKNMGVMRGKENETRDNVIGSWMFSCRVYRHGSAIIAVEQDGTVKKFDDKGEGHKVREIDDEGLEIASGVEEDETAFVYPEYKDPELWEET